MILSIELQLHIALIKCLAFLYQCEQEWTGEGKPCSAVLDEEPRDVRWRVSHMKYVNAPPPPTPPPQHNSIIGDK